MQEEKTATTVFSQLITKMYQDPAKFAAIAGIKVKEFSKLLKEVEIFLPPHSVPCRVVGEEVNITLLTLVEPRKGKLNNTF